MPIKSAPAPKKSERPSPKSASSLTSTAELVGASLGKLANRLDAARQGVKGLGAKKAKKGKPSTPVTGGVRKGHDRGKKVSPETLKVTHTEWKARMKQDRVAQRMKQERVEHIGVGKKATHSARPVARRLQFER